jgi:serine/threonine protein phosphatase 1
MQQAPRQPPVPALTFAIGDIHGCVDKLHSLLSKCENLAAGTRARYVFIGDYIDRGPDANRAIQTIIDLQKRPDAEVICLRGNHEDLLLNCFEDGTEQLVHWLLMNGGAATLRSYGAESVHDIPREHLAWIRSLSLFYDDGKRYFVHAGVDPDLPLSEQSEHDQLWIREPFLSSDKIFDRFIVHGHTPQESGLPDIRPNRLNIDTAAVYGGKLTAAVFTDEVLPVKFLTD